MEVTWRNAAPEDAGSLKANDGYPGKVSSIRLDPGWVLGAK
jgi:hypothetical protein